MFFKHTKYNNTGIIKLFNLCIEYGRVEVTNDKAINLVFPQCFNNVPYVWISPCVKSDLVTNYIDKSNAIYTKNITNLGFQLNVQSNAKMNDIADYISWVAIGKR